MPAPGLVWRTVRHLKPVQVWGQLRRRVPDRPQQRTEHGPLPIRERNGTWVRGLAKPTTLLANDVFRFLNVERKVEAPSDWYQGDASYLWFYNLQYHDWLNQSEFPGGREGALRWLRTWAAEVTIGTPRAWDPYPLSLRAFNWLRFALEHGGLPPDLALSAANQVRWLRRNLETHLLANHYLTNGKTLLMAGLFFAGAEADEWLATGRSIVSAQIAEQVLRDGGHYERSPMYHAIVAEDILDLLNAARAYGNAKDPSIEELLATVAPKVLRWAKVMRYPDGSLPQFNDTAQGIAPGYEELSLYAQRLNLSPGESVDDRHGVLLAESGFARLERGSGLLFCDVGTVGPAYQPGHAHAGTLSFEFALRDRRILVNTGISTYDSGAVRSSERATSAHNALDVQGTSSSEVWASFRVGERAHARVLQFSDVADATSLTAEHDGYRRQHIAGLHRRAWTMRDRSLEIEDEMTGAARSWVRVYFHFAPGIELRLVEAASWELLEGRDVLARLTGDRSWSYTLQQYLHHPEFGRSEPGWLLAGSVWSKNTPAQCVHVITW